MERFVERSITQRRKTMTTQQLTRAEFCIAQSVIAAIRNISSMYESDRVEHEICTGDGVGLMADLIEKNTTRWQRENAAEFLKFLPQPNAEAETSARSDDSSPSPCSQPGIQQGKVVDEGDLAFFTAVNSILSANGKEPLSVNLQKSTRTYQK